MQKENIQKDSPKIKKFGVKKQRLQDSLRSVLKDNLKLVIDILDENKEVDFKKILKILSHSQEENINKEYILQKLNEKYKKNDIALQENLEAFNTLIQKGYVKPQMIIKALKKNGGDVEKAEEFLKFKQEKFQNKNNDFHEQIVFLIQQDVENPMMIKKSLKKAKGDKDLALELLQDSEKMRNFKSKDKKDKKEKKYIYKKHLKNQEENEEKDEILEKLSELKLENIPEKITKLYVDGNNCFFIKSQLRKAILEKKQKSKVELAILEILKEFQNEDDNNIQKTVLIYDNTNLKIQSDSIVVESAMPKLKTADDYLVHLCETQQDVSLENTLFVTSDFGLQKRLMEKGAKNIIKSGRFFDCMENSISKDKFQEIIDQQLSQ